MDDSLKLRGDARLEAALVEHAVADPRAFYRDRLRWLREHDRAAFDRALAHYEEVLLPRAAADGTDALHEWETYGRLLADLSGAGRFVSVDPGGLAAPTDDGGDDLMLHVPDSDDTPVLVLRQPAAPSAAQNATVDLLVYGRTSLRTDA